MIKIKTIEVKEPACDFCERVTTRPVWKTGHTYRFCKKDEWVGDILNIYFRAKNYSPTSGLEKMLTFLKVEFKEL